MYYIGNFEVFVNIHKYENMTICMAFYMIKTFI